VDLTKQEHFYTAGGNKTSTTPMESSMEILQKVKDRTSI
jgi:hypothetical protein